VIAEAESTIASRSGETEAGEGVVTERTLENLESVKKEIFGRSGCQCIHLSAE
jgi:hypothetical protein